MLHTKKILGLAAAIAAATSAHAAEGVKPAAEALFHVGPLPVTNSMVTSWIVAAVLLVAIRLAVGTPKLVPGRGQALVEGLVEGIMDLVSPIVGAKAVKSAFPLLVCLFIFILIQNWSGLVPGVGTVYMKDPEGRWMEAVRPGNADLNGTFALAVVAFVGWLYLILRYAGPKMILFDLFGNKADRREIPALIYYFLFVVFFAVGLIEVISIMFRPISLSFRLYGNVLGGENLLHSMSEITRWGLPVPFYFLEVLIGFVQAFVFTLLVSVYIGLLCNHGDDHAEGDAHAAEESGHH
ncbi:MAG TPA: F0F1 ATP synthase subunit A [Candidatus Didemnitutus sp.]|nr:F0F1 ATP synthase subunit A [Candidatus Didemnitutus sp.]